MPLLLFVIGIFFVPLLFWFPEHAKYIAGLIVIFWGNAYLFILSRKYRKKKPFYNRGGIVTYEDNATEYKISYFIRVLLACVFLFGFLLVILFRKIP